MSKPNPAITAHMIVKNEDRWVWYAINALLPYVDHFLITDTGSSDKTLELIRSIHSPKIKFNRQVVKSRQDVTVARINQLKATKTDWIWIIDGDEIYPEVTIREILRAVNSERYEGIVVRRYDLLGDLYHRQDERVGSYELYGQAGHLVTRLVNQQKIAGLHYLGEYPLEGWYDGDNRSTHDRDPRKWYFTDNRLYHTMYLKRSSLGSNLSMINRGKFKIETGIKLNSPLPEVFAEHPPLLVQDPLLKRGLIYELLATIITPIKQLKRRYL